MVNEDTFKKIYSQFFPQGGKKDPSLHFPLLPHHYPIFLIPIGLIHKPFGSHSHWVNNHRRENEELYISFIFENKKRETLFSNLIVDYFVVISSSLLGSVV